MANPQLENGFIKISNEIYEALMRVRLASSENRILMAIFRKTYGFNKKEDRISLSQFAEMTGISRRNCLRVIQGLKNKNLITVKKISHVKVIYAFQKDHDRWQTDVKKDNTHKDQLLSNRVQTVVSSDTKTVVSPDNNKRQYKYKNKIQYSEGLPSKEHLEVYLQSLSEFKIFKHKTRELIVEFTNKVRLANKTRNIAVSRIKKVVTALAAISEKYGELSLIHGIEKVFSKDRKEGFNYKSRNPTAYAMSVAKDQFYKDIQRKTEQNARLEREAIGNIGKNIYCQKIEGITKR